MLGFFFTCGLASGLTFVMLPPPVDRHHVTFDMSESVRGWGDVNQKSNKER
jgi:hypothetical protein